ncbi:MAG: phytoene desaturase family protein [Bacteroidota bacterium]|nr:phytoene desaturase family protein [Bacteroidota bacterium]
MTKIAIIGSGFSGISASAYLAAAGYDVHVFEKNAHPGGRARQLQTDSGYVFDMGPSWYWMPGVFEKFFSDFGYSVSQFYELKLLNPSFDVVFGQDDTMSVPENFSELCDLFESIEKGSAAELKKFMDEAEYKYKTGIENLVYKPGLSLTEFADIDLIKGVFRLQVFSSFSKHVRKYFSNPKLLALMEFPVLFLGAMPKDTPALYSLMNYAGLKLGTWYPIGGFSAVIDAMIKVAKKSGVTFHLNSVVEKIEVENNLAKNIVVKGEKLEFDAIIASADYHHVESKLLTSEYRNYNEKYWEKKTFAPSCLIYYLGISRKIESLNHHTLFFEEDLSLHAEEIYKKPKWPTKPLFYACCASKSDNNIAPKGHENLFLLMPIAPGLNDSEEEREKYFLIMMKRLEKQTKKSLIPFIDYKKSYCVNDFISDYNSYKGNAYGLANTLLQTAHLKPKIFNKKVKNLFYAGQLTLPGPGVPPSIISGKVVAEVLIKQLKNSPREVPI